MNQKIVRIVASSSIIACAVFGRFSSCRNWFCCGVITLCIIMPVASTIAQDKGEELVKQREQSVKKAQNGDAEGVKRTAEIIAERAADIERLLERLHRLGPIDLPMGVINDAAVRSLVRLQATETVTRLCDEVISAPSVGGPSPNRLPVARALIDFGGSSIPGIYDSLAKGNKSDHEIKVFAFVLGSIDGGDAELTAFRLERQIKQRTEESERNAIFKKNANRILKCVTTPDFFRHDNNPFYGN